MKVFRLAISVLGVAGLAIGYFASQTAYFSGRAAEYAQAVDQPAVRYASLALLAAAILLAFIPDREGDKT